MKKLILTLTAVCTGLLSMAQLNAVVTEVYTPTGAATVQPAGTTTYRVYAECGSPTDKISAVFAILDCHPLNVSTTTTMFNDGFGGVTPAGINIAFPDIFPGVELDSWVTINVVNSASPGASDIGVASTVPADPWASSVGNAGTGNLLMEDGAWYTLPTSPSGSPTGPLNRVLLGQFTTDGELSFNINIQMFVGGDQVNGRVDYVHTAGCYNGGTETGFEVGPGDAGYPDGLTYPAVGGCADTEVTFDMTDSADDGWNGGTYEVYDVADPLAPVLVASGDLDNAATGDGTGIGQDLLCLPDGCYELTVGGGSWESEIGWTLTGADVSPISGGAPETVAFSINTTCPIYGCIDPTACNYDAGADTDDGSCIFPAANDLCAGAVALSVGTINIDNTAACQNEVFGISGSGCNATDGWCTGDGDEQSGIWYTFTTGATDEEVSIEASNDGSGTLTDTQIAIFDGCGGTLVAGNDDGNGLHGSLSFACGDLAPNTTYYVIVDGYNGDSGTCDLTFSQDAAACALGCTNPAACNYDAGATVDDGSCCLENCVELIVDGGTFASEVSFDIYDADGNLAFSGNGSTGSATLCLMDGCIQIDMFDSYGDGWNGASLDFQVGGSSIGVFDVDGSYFTVNGGTGGGIISGTDYLDLGATGLCPVLGCTDPTACNYDAAADTDDGSCIAGPCINDLPELAYALSVDPLGTCNGLSGEDMDAATVSSGEGTYNVSDNDLWYSFVPTTSGVSIDVFSADFDAVVQLFDAALGNEMIEDVTLTGDSEILNVGSLTAGDTYLIRVSPWNPTAGPALFDICVQSIPDTRCDYGSGPYDLCDLFKADWVGADDYIFTFTSQTSGIDYVYQAGGANTFVLLSSVADLGWDDTYDVSINSVFMIADGNGNMQTIEVENDEPCSIDVNPQPLAALRASDNVVNYGAHYLGDYIAATPFVCGVVDWTWQFTNTDGSQLPITHLRGAANRYMRLSDVSGLVPGATYDVIVKPEFSNGAATLYGAVDQISLIGPAGIVGEIESVVVLPTEANRVDAVDAADLNVYPNPASDIVTFNLTNIADGVEIVMIDILDATGRIVVSEQVSVNGSMNYNMSVNNLANGMYNVRFTMNGNSQVERLVIQK